MAIAVKLDDLLHDRRMTLTELADRIGMALANLSILKTGKARAIRFSTLEAICGALSCQPGDLLRFEPEQAQRERPAAASQRSASRGTSSRINGTFGRFKFETDLLPNWQLEKQEYSRHSQGDRS